MGLLSTRRVFSSSVEDSSELVVGLFLPGSLGGRDDATPNRVHSSLAGAADTFSPVVCSEVSPAVGVASFAVRFVELRVAPMSDPILHVFGWSAPRKVFEPVVFGVAVEMAADMPGWSFPDECVEDCGVDGDVVWAASVVAVQAEGGVAVAVVVWFECFLLKFPGLPRNGGDGSGDAFYFSSVGNFVSWVALYRFPCRHKAVIAASEVGSYV